MWGLFFAAALAGALFLYVPAALALAGFRMHVASAIAFAPLVGIPATIALCLLYAQVGITANWATIFFPQLVAGLVICIAGRLRARDLPRRRFGERSPEACRFDMRALALYIGVGVVVSAVMFAGFLQDPSSYMQEYDNISHMGSIRCFVESGNWSPFNTSLYASAADAAINPLSGSGFYPTAWYNVSAFMVSLLGVPVTLAENAANFVFVGVALPASMFAFMRIVFQNRRDIVCWGAACVLAFSAFPWMLIAWGPLYPNTSAYCLVPLVAALFVAILRTGAPRRERFGAAALFVVGIVALAFAQPNAVFVVAVWLIPFCIYRAAIAADLFHREGTAKWQMRILFAAVAAVLICVIWWVVYHLPFLSAVVEHSWGAAQYPLEAVFHALMLGFMDDGVQLVLMVFVFVGMFWTFKERRWLWLSASYVLACGMFIVGVSTSGRLQHLLTGFWYTDYYRVAAMAALFGVPLASMGIALVARTLASAFSRLGDSQGNPATRWAAPAACAICAVVLAAGMFAPVSEDEERPATTDEIPQMDRGSMCSVLQRLAWQNNVNYIYTTPEKEFVAEVEKIIPEGAVVINNPNDGSCFCYVVDGMRTYYRYLRTYGEGGETRDSELIRSRLDCVDTDERVREAVENVGAQYLLLLDQGRQYNPSDPDSNFFFTYEDNRLWAGIDDVRDSTPGFEVVLARDDMRLYRITAIDD